MAVGRLPLRPARCTPGVTGRGTAGSAAPRSTGTARWVCGAWQPQAAGRQAEPGRSENPRRDPGSDLGEGPWGGEQRPQPGHGTAQAGRVLTLRLAAGMGQSLCKNRFCGAVPTAERGAGCRCRSAGPRAASALSSQLPEHSVCLRTASLHVERVAPAARRIRCSQGSGYVRRDSCMGTVGPFLNLHTKSCAFFSAQLLLLKVFYFVCHHSANAGGKWLSGCNA